MASPNKKDNPGKVFLEAAALAVGMKAALVVPAIGVAAVKEIATNQPLEVPKVAAAQPGISKGAVKG